MISRKGLSLLEILVATMLLALVTTGLANIFVATKRLTTHARTRATAAEITKFYAAPLQMRITAQNWGVTTATGNCLRMFTQAALVVTPWADSASLTTFTPTYDFAPANGVADIDDIVLDPVPTNPPTSMVCRVPLRINWDERTSQ